MNPKILVIEDELEIREIIVDLLSEEGYNVHEACDGQAGLDAIEKVQPDLIVSDVGMPRVTGFELLEQVRSNPKTSTTSFILLTALTDRTDVRHGMSHGADDYITKPFSSDELLDSVQAILQKVSAYQAQHAEEAGEIGSVFDKLIPSSIREPLSTVVGIAQLLKSDWASMDAAAIEECLSGIEEAATDMGRVAENLSLYAGLRLHPNSLHISSDDPSAYASDNDILQAMVECAERWKRTDQLDIELEPFALKVSREAMVKTSDELLTHLFYYTDADSSLSIKGKNQDDGYLLTITGGNSQLPDPTKAEEFEPQLGLALACDILERVGGKLVWTRNSGGENQVIILLPHHRLAKAA